MALLLDYRVYKINFFPIYDVERLPYTPKQVLALASLSIAKTPAYYKGLIHTVASSLQGMAM